MTPERTPRGCWEQETEIGFEEARLSAERKRSSHSVKIATVLRRKSVDDVEPKRLALSILPSRPANLSSGAFTPTWPRTCSRTPSRRSATKGFNNAGMIRFD